MTERQVPQVYEHATADAIEASAASLLQHESQWRICEVIAKSGLAPSGLNTPEAVYVAVLTGKEAGLSTTAALQSVAVIKGTATWRGKAALALLRSKHAAKAIRVGCEKIPADEAERLKLGPDEDIRGFMRWIDHETGEEMEEFYTVADAKRARLWGKTGRNGELTPWVTDPKAMLKWRAVSRAVNAYFSHVLLGLDVAEVVQDFADDPVPRPTLPASVPSTPVGPSGGDPLLAAALAGDDTDGGFYEASGGPDEIPKAEGGAGGESDPERSDPPAPPHVDEDGGEAVSPSAGNRDGKPVAADAPRDAAAGATGAGSHSPESAASAPRKKAARKAAARKPAAPKADHGLEVTDEKDPKTGGPVFLCASHGCRATVDERGEFCSDHDAVAVACSAPGCNEGAGPGGFCSRHQDELEASASAGDEGGEDGELF